MTIYTAIFSKYDTLKEPSVVTPGWKYVVFTDQELFSDTWEIRKVECRPEGAQRTARYYKIMFHEVIKDENSIWIDGSFKINCNLNLWWSKFQSRFTVISHPDRDCVYDEARECIVRMKDSTQIINEQVDYYRKCGMPAHFGLIQSGILLRKRTEETIEFCNLWYQQLVKFSVRDQLSFSFTDWNMQKIAIKVKWNYMKQKEFEFSPHIPTHERIKAR